MTIREHIKRRIRNLVLIVAIAYAVLQILSTCICHWPEHFTAKPRLLVLGLTAPSALFVILAWLAIIAMTHLPAMLSPARRCRSGCPVRK
jgi:hypothetical protein